MKRFIIVVGISFSMILVLPSLLLPWSLIDDGADVLHIQALLAGNLSGLFEWPVGRIRPAFWLARAVQTAIFGQQVWLYHLTRIAMFVACAGLVYAIARQVAPQSKRAALISVVLFAFCPWGWEIWFRLGPQEGYVILWSLISTYGLLRSVSGSRIAYWIAVISISLAIFSKETAVVQGILALALVWMLRKEYPKWQGKAYVLAALASSLSVIVLVWMLPKQGYNKNYQMMISAVFANAMGYLPFYLSYLPLLAIGAAGMIRMPRPTIYQLRWPFYFFAWAFCWFAVQLPWGFTISRYLLPSAVGLSLGIGFLLAQLPVQFPLIKIFTPVSLAVFLGSSLLAYILFVPNYLTTERAGAAIVSTINDKVGADGIIYTDLPANDERSVEMGIHLRWLYERSDVQFVPVAREQLAALDGWHLATGGNPPGNWQLFR